ncbi:phosphotransferase [Dermacoccaceae bacterium W4C1]
MLRRPLHLAALADAAVPGLMPVQVEGLPVPLGAAYQRAVLTDADGRTWIVRSALSTSAAAGLDRSATLARLLRTRLPFSVPLPAGVMSLPDGTAIAVHRTPEGENADFDALSPRSSLARSIGQTLAALHDLEPGVFEEAGLPIYEADEVRTRRLAELDRAAETGHVPTALLQRWERALEDVALWRFVAVPTHGALSDSEVLVNDDGVVALDGWHAAAVGDPAQDLTQVFLHAAPDAFDTVVETYAQARRERPDSNLERRVRLSAELDLVRSLMAAVGDENETAVERQARLLRRLAKETADDDSLTPPPVGRRTAPVAEQEDLDPEDIEEVEGPTSDDEETLEIPLRSAPAAEGAGSDDPRDAGDAEDGSTENADDADADPESGVEPVDEIDSVHATEDAATDDEVDGSEVPDDAQDTDLETTQDSISRRDVLGPQGTREI